jgi:hypothetical protein
MLPILRRTLGAHSRAGTENTHSIGYRKSSPRLLIVNDGQGVDCGPSFGIVVAELAYMFSFVRLLGLSLLLLLVGTVWAGWQPVDSITHRDKSDISSQSNARSVVADASGNIHVVWRGRVGGVWQPWYSRREAATAEWSQDTVLRVVSGGVCDPTCAVDADQSLLVCWNDSASGTMHLLRRRPASPWSELDSLPGSQGDSMVSMCVDSGGTVHIVWRRSDLTGSCICYAAHGDSGWSRPETLTAPGQRGSWPAVACGTGDTIMAVWVGSSAQSIVSRLRTAGSWLARESVYAGTAANPCVARSQDSFYVVWLSGMFPNQHVLIRVRSAAGWSDTTRLNRWRVGQPGVSIAADTDGALHVVWLGSDSTNRSYPTVQYRQRPAGEDWHAQQFLDAEPGDRLRASASSGRGRIQVVWSYYPTVGGVPAVHLRRYEQVHDVGVTRIVQPTDTVDSGTVVHPAAWMKNFGDYEESGIPCKLSFSGYVRLETLPSLVPSDSAWMGFDSVTVKTRGWNAVTCSTSLAGDANKGNDAVRDSFFVRVGDVSADSVIAPGDTVFDTLLTPVVIVHNQGNVSVDAAIHAWISGTAYHDSVTVRLSGDHDSAVSLGRWRTELGTHAFRCSVLCASDVHPENDTLSKEFRVVFPDVGVVEITAPPDTVDSAHSVTPAAVVRNFGVTAATFDVRMRIGSFYSSTRSLNALKPDSTTDVSFDEWMPCESGVLAVCCSTMLAADCDPTNDARCCSVFVRVESLESSRWTELQPVPAGPWKRAVRDGGSLVATAEGLLALKGANTREFYKYSTAMDTWTVLAAMPAADSGRRVKSGAALCWDGRGAVYALKGNNTREFWRYDIGADSWCRLADIPEHTTRVRLSSGLVFAPGKDTDKVFLVKGGNTREFFVYWVTQNEWHSRRSLPAGPEATRAYRGTCLALLGSRTFCLKGGTTEFYEYSPNGDSWRVRASLPRIGRGSRNRKVGRGAALVSDRNRFLYALKGGNANEFWRYDDSADAWTQLDDVPGGGRLRRVGRGGALAWFEGRAYALKGGGAREFWCYDPGAAFATAFPPGRDGVVETAGLPPPMRPNGPRLLHRGSSTRYSVPDGASDVLVIDAAGRLVKRVRATDRAVEICFTRPGIYFVLAAGDSAAYSAKTVLIR